MSGIPDNLKELLSFEGFQSNFFENIKLVNLNIKDENTLKQLGFYVPAIGRPDFNAALKKGHVTLPVMYGTSRNEIYDVDGNYVCYLLEV